MLARPLINLLKKNTNFVWGPVANEAFLVLKQAMISPPVLNLSDFNETFVIETDVSGSGLGPILSQKGHPIAYASKVFSAKKKPFSAYERELLAIVFAVRQWRSYLWGRKLYAWLYPILFLHCMTMCEIHG